MGAGICCKCGRHRKLGVHFHAGAAGLVCRTCYWRNYAPLRRCFICTRPRTASIWFGDAAYCDTCYKREVRLDVCVFCLNERRIHARTDDNGAICLPCYEERFVECERCMDCGELATPTARGPNGECICYLCQRKRTKEKCVRCGNERTVARRLRSGRGVCQQCVKGDQPLERCPYCKRMRRLMHREDGDAICGTCYPKHLAPRHACDVCGDVRPVAKWRTPTQPICGACYQRMTQPTFACSICTRVRPASRITPGGPICNTCYARVRRRELRGERVKIGPASV